VLEADRPRWGQSVFETDAGGPAPSRPVRFGGYLDGKTIAGHLEPGGKPSRAASGIEQRAAAFTGWQPDPPGQAAECIVASAAVRRREKTRDRETGVRAVRVRDARVGLNAEND